jgi:ABC-type glutathione transport system ATPase component
VSFQVKKGEILCLAGESGSGKSTTGLAVLRLVQPTEGSVLFKKEDITGLKKKELKSIRRYMQMVFQDPYESLNPRMTVFDTLAEPLQIHHMKRPKEETRKKVAELLEDVELCGGLDINLDVIDYTHASLSPSNTDFYDAIDSTMQGLAPGSSTLLRLSTGMSDNRFWRALGSVVY